MADKVWKPKIEYRDPKTLIPYLRNINVHSDEQINTVAHSISAYGFDQPIVVDKEGVIIKGHCRREASIRLALPEVPVVVADHLTDEEATASRIMDKKSAEKSQWDQDTLKFELQSLDLAGFNLSLTGFELPEVRAFLDEGEIAPEFFGGPRTTTPELEKPKDRPLANGAVELSEDSFNEFTHQCPRCSFEFNAES